MTVLLILCAVGTVAAMAAPLVRRTRTLPKTVLAAVTNLTLGLIVTAVAVPAFGQITGSYRLIPILSGSMEPSMARGDAAWVEPVPLDDIKAGDVIVFTAPDTVRSDLAGQRVMHRVLETVDPDTVINPVEGTRYLRTQGDNNTSPDPWILGVDTDQVWARTGVFPHAGTVIGQISVTNAREWVLYGAAVLLVAYGVHTITSGVRENRQNRAARVEQSGSVSGPVRTIGAVLATVGVTFTGVGAWAAFTDTEPTRTDVTAGVVAVSLTEGTNRMTVTFEDLIPGQSVWRAVDLEHVGTIDLYGNGPQDPPDAVGLQLHTHSPTPTGLTDDHSDGLQLQMWACPVPWTETTDPDGLYTYVCPGDAEIEIFGDEPILGRRDLPRTVMNAYSPGGVDHLAFEFRLPASAPGAYQDLTETVTFDFVAVQRTGINK